MFVKTFSDMILKELGGLEGCKVVIVYVWRDLEDVVMSQVQLGWFKEGHSGYRNWYYRVGDVQGSEKVLGREVERKLEGGSVIDQAIGYNLDIRARAEKLKRDVEMFEKKGLLGNVNQVDVSLKDIDSRNPRGLSEFLKEVGLEVDSVRLELLGKQEKNARDFKKSLVQQDINRDMIRQRLDELT